MRLGHRTELASVAEDTAELIVSKAVGRANNEMKCNHGNDETSRGSQKPED